MDILIMILIGFVLLFFVIAIIWFISRQQRRQVEAIEEEPRAIGRREMIPFDDEAAEVLERRIVRCSKCDEEVSPYDEECPHCGARLSVGIYECSSCGKEVDPRDKECPHCGEILLPEPYVCPSCGKPVEEDARRCDICGARFWSPILLDERSLKKKAVREEPEPEPEPERDSPRRPVRRRSLR
jgi:DNA-directed RNA polymerase subunit RPC12/RpoP/Na+-transporting methylmalonyl-CoA/oxaloacetate decarboxylase gamma subunit